MIAANPGLPFVAALYGTFHAGAVAVPAFPPVGKRAISRFRSIFADAKPDVVILDQRVERRIRDVEANLPDGIAAPSWVFLDELFANSPPVDIDPIHFDPAVIQYTSGSTGEPKGIVLSHANLVSNCRSLQQHMGEEPDRVGLSWLPPYHDMGLMGTIMLAVESGWPLVMMSPLQFVQSPFRWLKAVSDNAVTISVGPNFAFDLCCSSVTDEQIATLDLSSLRQVFCGAEPISAATLAAFSHRFATAGFKESALVPCYGLAEATLFVSGRPNGQGVRTAVLDRAALEEGRCLPAGTDGNTVVTAVSCGEISVDHEVLVVDPDSCQVLPPGSVGEIWVNGPSVALGYLDRPEMTEETFCARISGDHRDRVYLRTGDLGFYDDGELYVTGRIKDLIILAGRNLHPQDVEASVRRAHDGVRQAVAFSVGDPEQLVVIAEYAGTPDRFQREEQVLRRAVTAAVTTDHGLSASDVQFAPVGAIPRTTSGKVRRSASRADYTHGSIRLFSAGVRS